MRRSVGPLRLLLAGTLLSLVVPSGARAQSLEDSELRYREALSAHDLALASRDRVANRFYSLLDSLTAARDADDQASVDAIEGRFRDVGVELSRLQSRLSELEEDYEVARGALLESLAQRLDSLGRVAATSSDPLVRASIGDRIVDMQVQYAQVAAEELRDTLGPPSMMLPAFRIDPRDTPATLRAKAELLEEKAAEFQREIDRVDELLGRYDAERRLAQFAGDARAARERFGDTQVPVRGSGGAGRAEQGLAADTLGVDLESLAPEDAIARLQAWRASLVVARDQTLAAAETLRSGSRGTPRPEDPR